VYFFFCWQLLILWLERQENIWYKRQVLQLIANRRFILNKREARKEGLEQIKYFSNKEGAKEFIKEEKAKHKGLLAVA
jgi:hypothetical protein